MRGEAIASAILTVNPEANKTKSYSNAVQEKKKKQADIDCQSTIWSVAFLADGNHIVSGGDDRKIRRWGVQDGKEAGGPIEGGPAVLSMEISQNGKWVVCGALRGRVVVWDAESGKKVAEFKAHKKSVAAADVSPDAKKIVTGSYDTTLCVWSLSTGQRLLGPFKHNKTIAAAKFSPDGRLISTASDSVRIYDSLDGRLLVDCPVQVSSFKNQALTWVGDSKQLFALSVDGDIHCLDLNTGKTVSKWTIHSSHEPRCISLASNGTFIAASANSSVSFWDTTTHKQIGSIVHHPAHVASIAISTNYRIVVGGGRKITLQTLLDILPSPYVASHVSESAA